MLAELLRMYYSSAPLEPVWGAEVRELGLVVLSRKGELVWNRGFATPATESALRELILQKPTAEVHVSVCTCPPDALNSPNCTDMEAFVDLDFEELGNAELKTARSVYQFLTEDLVLNCDVRYSGNRSVQFVCRRTDGLDFTRESLSFLRKVLKECKAYGAVDAQALSHCHMRRVWGSLNKKTGLPAVLVKPDILEGSAEELRRESWKFLRRVMGRRAEELVSEMQKLKQK